MRGGALLHPPPPQTHTHPGEEEGRSEGTSMQTEGGFTLFYREEGDVDCWGEKGKVVLVNKRVCGLR